MVCLSVWLLFTQYSQCDTVFHVCHGKRQTDHFLKRQILNICHVMKKHFVRSNATCKTKCEYKIHCTVYTIVDESNTQLQVLHTHYCTKVNRFLLKSVMLLDLLTYLSLMMQKYCLKSFWSTCNAVSHNIMQLKWPVKGKQLK